jgi:hypothetical protein
MNFRPTKWKVVVGVLVVVLLIGVLYNFYEYESLENKIKGYSEYYKTIIMHCDSACCFKSVERMEESGYELALNEECINDDYKINALRCEGSYSWCELIWDMDGCCAKCLDNPRNLTDGLCVGGYYGDKDLMRCYTFFERKNNITTEDCSRILNGVKISASKDQGCSMGKDLFIKNIDFPLDEGEAAIVLSEIARQWGEPVQSSLYKIKEEGNSEADWQMDYDCSGDLTFVCGGSIELFEVGQTYCVNHMG